MQIYWTPEPEGARDTSAWVPRTRLGRFLGVSAAVHVVGAVAAAWFSLSLLPPPDDGLVVRTIDFVEAPAASAPPRGTPKATDGAAGGPTVPGPARARGAAAPRAAPPAKRSEPAAAKAPAAPKAAPAAPQAPASVPTSAGDLPVPAAPPAPSPEEQRIASAMPKSVGSGATVSRGPSPVQVPSRESSSGAIASATAGVEGGVGPVATVAIPGDVVRATAGAGSGTGPGAGGSGVGSGSGGAGTADGVAGGRGGGTGPVDMRDPDFSEYFRLIERRVRESWKFPESLGGTTQTVKIGFALAAEGSLRDVKVVSSSSGSLNDSALAAMKRAAPFPPLPEKFRKLAGQPLVMSFTVVIR
jgi:TonB family protein